jgi:hypothetical protein
VHLWEVIAEHYKGNPWVAGFNPVNEPAGGLGDDDLIALADSFALANCDVREPLHSQLRDAP